MSAFVASASLITWISTAQTQSSFLSGFKGTAIHRRQTSLGNNKTVRHYSNPDHFRLYRHARFVPISCTINQKDERASVRNGRPHSKKTARLGVLVSGGGRSVENLCQLIAKGDLQRCEIVLMISSKASAGAIEKVRRYDIETEVLQLSEYDKDIERYSTAISETFDRYDVDYIIMAGWMHFYSIPSRYLGKVINIHPSLIPSFCGKGYYGSRVHQAVLDFGVKITGCTVHFADNVFDHGPIILQAAVEVRDDDTVDSLASRVFESEKLLLPKAIQLLVDGRVVVKQKENTTTVI